MIRHNKASKSILLLILLLILILNANTAVNGMRAGIDLCIRTVIPALFPFLILSGMLCPLMLGSDHWLIRFIAKLCKMPQGTGSLFLIGLVGGYPVGARCVAQAYSDGCVDAKNAHRLMGFCSNAGPSFIFGMTAALFTSPHAPWFTWLIQILSAVLVARILPIAVSETSMLKAANPIPLTKAAESAMKSMANVCCWVVLFRIGITFIVDLLPNTIPAIINVLICGICELTNGCAALSQVTNEKLRFILCNGMLSFGGLCVYMQTASQSMKLGVGLYFPGKLLQCLLSSGFAALFCGIIY